MRGSSVNVPSSLFLSNAVLGTETCETVLQETQLATWCTSTGVLNQDLEVKQHRTIRTHIITIET